MKLAQAVKYFSTENVDAWDRQNQRWIPNVAVATFKAFDQFITQRTFGQKKRLIAVPGDGRISAAHNVVRISEGTRYIVIEENPDVRRSETYQYIYLLQIVEFDVKIIRTTTETLGTGMQGSPVESTADTVPCDKERFSGATLDDRSDVKLSIYSFTVPLDTDVTTDDMLEEGTTRYSIREVNRVLGVIEIIAVKHGGKA